MAVKEGDTVLLPEYGGTEVKLDNKEYVFFFMICFIRKCRTQLSYDSHTTQDD